MEPSLPPTARPISRRRLTFLLLAISLIPPLFVLSMWGLHKPSPEPLLDVKVTQSVTVMSPRKSPGDPRILPCLIIENPTGDTWRNIAVCINKEFFFYQPDPLEAKQQFVVPLEFFVTKGGNVAFQPGSETLRQVTVFAQIPSGARAVCEIFFDQETGFPPARE